MGEWEGHLCKGKGEQEKRVASGEEEEVHHQNQVGIIAEVLGEMRLRFGGSERGEKVLTRRK